MKILLVAPRDAYYAEGADYYFPLGIAYVSAALKSAGFDVTCINAYQLRMSLEDRMKELAASGVSFDIVGTGGLSTMYYAVKEVIDLARGIFPKASILAGGHLVSCMPEAIMKDLGIDYGVIGEGEVTSVELLRALENGDEVKGIPGSVVFDKREGVVVVGPTRDCIRDLDSLSFPDYDGLEMGQRLDMLAPQSDFMRSSYWDKPKTAFIMGSRSCPFNCTFCFHIPGHKYSQRSLDSIFLEIDYLIEKYGITFFSMLDEVFIKPNDHNRLEQFCAGMKKRKVNWSCQVMLQYVNEDILRMVKDSGCITLGAGIENASPVILKSMQKPVTREMIDSTLDMAYDIGISVGANILFGDAAETWDTFWETYRWWMKNRHHGINISMIGTLPNAKIYRDAVKKGIIKDELEYVKHISKNGIPASEINITTLCDEEYAAMKKFVYETRDVSGYFGGIALDSHFQKVDDHDRKRYYLKAMCPHCGLVNEYDGLATPNSLISNGYYNLICRKCTKRFDVRDISVAEKFPNVSDADKRLHTSSVPLIGNIDDIAVLTTKASIIKDMNIIAVLQKKNKIPHWKRGIVRAIMKLPQPDMVKLRRRIFGGKKKKSEQ